MSSEQQQKTRAEKEQELRKQQAEAAEQLEAALSQSAPKNLRQGLTSGVSNILGGAIGAVGIAVLAPTAGLAMGAAEGGVLGGIIGLTGGAVVGALGAAAVAVGGILSGVSQIVRGVVAVPKSISEPRKGNWWDEHEGKWVETDLTKEKEKLEGIPDDDKDVSLFVLDFHSWLPLQAIRSSNNRSSSHLFIYADPRRTRERRRIAWQGYSFHRRSC